MREAIDLRIQAPRGIIGKVLQQLQCSCVLIARRWLGGLQEFRSFLTRPCRPYSCRATATLSMPFGTMAPHLPVLHSRRCFASRSHGLPIPTQCLESWISSSRRACSLSR